MKTETMTKQRKSPIIISQYFPLFPAKTNACALLDRFSPQNRLGEERKDAVSKNLNVEFMNRQFALFLKREWEYNNFKNYRECALDVSHNLYSASDISEFVLGLASFQAQPRFSEWAGFFISALINESKDEKFEIFTGHLDRKIEFLGAANKKRVVVRGDIGDFACIGMRSGSFDIFGNAGGFVGHEMEGGRVVVHGNAEHIADTIKGGSVRVVGSVETDPISGDPNFKGSLFETIKHRIKNSRLFRHLGLG